MTAMAVQFHPLRVDGGGGHIRSPLFNKLPAEIRVQIYEEAFAGSKLRLILIPSVWSDDPVPSGGRRSIFRSTGHHNFLLTCRAVYDEALSNYWSKTLVFCGTYDNVADRLKIPQAGHTFHTTYVANRISDFAKGQIKHLRQVNPFKGVHYGDTRRLSFPNFLSLFPKLETCEIYSVINRNLKTKDIKDDAKCMIEITESMRKDIDNEYRSAGFSFPGRSDPPTQAFAPKVLQKIILCTVVYDTMPTFAVYSRLRDPVSSKQAGLIGASNAYSGMAASSVKAEKLIQHHRYGRPGERPSWTTHFTLFYSEIQSAR